MNNSNIFTGSEIETRHMDIKCSVVLWNQWWDEGKGKITDILAQMSDVIIRFNGWHNAWHTVKVWDKEFDLHILPSGMVSEWKINIITSSCVLWIKLNKIDMNKVKVSNTWPYSHATLAQLLKRDKKWKIVEVWMIPELEKLRKWWIDIRKSGLKISWETPVIWMHNVLLDAFDEKCRDAAGLNLIWSTGSGISRAYAWEMQRYHFSLNDLLYNEEAFFQSIRALWYPYQHAFPKISADDLINEMKREKIEILEYIARWEIEVIANERDYIKHLKGIKIWEWAQSCMIGSANSVFGSASAPSLERFLNATWLTVKKVWNIFIISKMPGSSVWNRPWFLNLPDSPELNAFRKKYSEIWVSTGRERDLLYYSLTETARGAWLNLRGIDNESKVVPVFNRVDGIEDALKLDPSGKLRVVTGYDYKVKDILNGNKDTTISVGIQWNEKITPKELLKNYPEKSMQSKLFDVKEKDLKFLEVQGNDIQEKITNLLWYHLGAIYRKDEEREYLIWMGPSRDDLEMRKWSPLRK